MILPNEKLDTIAGANYYSFFLLGESVFIVDT